MIKSNNFFLIVVMFICFVSVAFSAAQAGEVGFLDINERDWYAEPVDWARQMGIVYGYPDGKFYPDEPVTERHFFAMLTRAIAGNESDPYEFMRSRNYPIYYKLDLALSRGEAAVYLAAVLGYVDEDNLVDGAIQFLYQAGIAEGVTDKTLDGFMTDSLLTRAQAAAFIKRAVESGLPLGMALEHPPKLKYPKEAIINGQNTERFAEIISNLPSIRNSHYKVSKVKVDSVHAVEVHQVDENGERIFPDPLIIVINQTHADYHTNIVSMFIRDYENEEILAMAREALSLYMNEEETERVLAAYIEYLTTGESLEFTTESGYDISLSYQAKAIVITWEGDFSS